MVRIRGGERKSSTDGSKEISKKSKEKSNEKNKLKKKSSEKRKAQKRGKEEVEQVEQKEPPSKKSKERTASKERSQNRGKDEVEEEPTNTVPLYPVYKADKENVFASRNAELELVKKYAKCSNAIHNNATFNTGNRKDLMAWRKELIDSMGFENKEVDILNTCGAALKLEKEIETVRWHVHVIGTYFKDVPWRKRESVLEATKKQHLCTVDKGKKRLIACVTNKSEKEKIIKALKKYEESSLQMWGPLFVMGDMITSVIKLLKGMDEKEMKSIVCDAFDIHKHRTEGGLALGTYIGLGGHSPALRDWISTNVHYSNSAAETASTLPVWLKTYLVTKMPKTLDPKISSKFLISLKKWENACATIPITTRGAMHVEAGTVLMKRVAVKKEEQIGDPQYLVIQKGIQTGGYITVCGVLWLSMDKADKSHQASILAYEEGLENGLLQDGAPDNFSKDNVEFTLGQIGISIVVAPENETEEAKRYTLETWKKSWVQESWAFCRKGRF